VHAGDAVGAGAATFVPVGGRVVLIEAVWPDDAAPGGRMPSELRLGYRRCSRG
jgi:hypothetical protein